MGGCRWRWRHGPLLGQSRQVPAVCQRRRTVLSARNRRQSGPTHSDHLAPTNFDGDGDIDIFAAAGAENPLLINQDGAYVPADLKPLGLPRKSMAANWVDVDNDGSVELHLMPGGLFRRENGVFHGVDGPDVRIRDRVSPVDLTDARVSWFDADDDGIRDVVVALDYVIKKRKWAQWYWHGRHTGPAWRTQGLLGCRLFWRVRRRITGCRCSLSVRRETGRPSAQR